MREGLLNIPTITGANEVRFSEAIESIIGPIVVVAFKIPDGSGVKVRLEATYDNQHWEATATTNDRDVLLEGNIAKEFKTSAVCNYRVAVYGGQPAQRNMVEVVWGRYNMSSYFDPQAVV